MAGRIPQSFINDLLTRVDIVDVIESRMTLKKTGKNYSGLCPFHDEKTPSFSVSPDKQFFHCFGCQESGTALTFIMNFDRLEFVEAVENLAQQLGLEVPREQTGTARAPVDPDLYEVLNKAERYYRQALRHAPQAIAYLKSRGLTGEVARDFGMGYAPPGWQNLMENLDGVSEKSLLAAGLATESDKGRVYDRFRDRIVFPIRDTRGRVIGFGGRTLTADDGPKYLNSPETVLFQKGQELYGLYEARRALRRIDRLILVEGYMDVVALAQHGVANAVATLGTASGEAHFHKLYRYTDEVVCCFDGDNAGRQAAWKALENALPTLTEMRQVKFVFLPDGEDPDSLIRTQGKAGFDQFVNNAVPGLEYLFSRLAQGLDLETVDGKARFGGLIRPYIDKVGSAELKVLLQQKVQSQTGFAAATARPALQRPVRNRSRGLVKLSERLLTMLVKHPEYWLDVPPEPRRKLVDAAADLGLLGEIVVYVNARAEVDTEELLIRWSDDEQSQRLLALAQTKLELPDEAIKGEFVDGMLHLCNKLEQAQRKSAIDELQKTPDITRLQQYWQHRSKSEQ
ncbi:MAG: DNA primase [bacterium]